VKKYESDNKRLPDVADCRTNGSEVFTMLNFTPDLLAILRALTLPLSRENVGSTPIRYEISKRLKIGVVFWEAGDGC
jgi:hypothetical protein